TYETVEARSGFDLDDRSHPLRIISYSKDLYNRNFIVGQFYDAGNQYQLGVRTRSNENAIGQTARLGGSLQDPLKSDTAAIIVPSAQRPARVLQKMVFTLTNNGVGRLYLSDLDGAMYLAVEKTSGFGNETPGNFFVNWLSDAYLNLGNENLLPANLTNIANSDGSPTTTARTEFNRSSANGSNLADCGDACANEPNRYWKGEFQRLAIYCGEVPKDQILGAAIGNVISNPVPAAPVDIAVASTADAAVVKAQNIYTRLTGVKKAATERLCGKNVKPRRNNQCSVE
ncbi:MAG: hypothetical protein K0R29_2153, partial [Pseudobdellovibrio sp.]|nr:hypothetical protein [Pseudobdellovibrio sp.]